MYLKHLILLLALVLALAAGAQAYRGGCPGQGHYQDFMSGLTPEQQQKVQALTDEHHKELFALHKELVTKHEAMEALFAATPADKAAIDKAVSEVSGLQAKKPSSTRTIAWNWRKSPVNPYPSNPAKAAGARPGAEHTPAALPQVPAPPRAVLPRKPCKPSLPSLEKGKGRTPAAFAFP